MVDSATFHFTSADTLTHKVIIDNWFYPKDSSLVSLDTSGTHLWHVGTTAKSVFAPATQHSYGIMTDTLHPYPAKSNEGFVLKIINSGVNPIIEIWHEYDMMTGHAGGYLEFSTDTGHTWVNLVDCAYAANNGYNYFDTILSGKKAFTGTSSGQVHTKYQMINCVGSKQTNTVCFFNRMPVVYLRFHFVSDSTTNTSYSG